MRGKLLGNLGDPGMRVAARFGAVMHAERAIQQTFGAANCKPSSRARPYVQRLSVNSQSRTRSPVERSLFVLPDIQLQLGNIKNRQNVSSKT